MLRDWLYIATIALLSVLLFNKCTSDSPSTENNVADIIKLDKKEAVKYTDQNNKPHIRKQVIESDRATIHAYYHAKIDSFSKALKIKDDQITGFTEVSYKEEHTFRPAVTNVVDTVSGKKKKLLSWSDTYISFNGEVTDTDSDRDSALMNYRGRNKVKFVFFDKPAGWLKMRKDVYVDAMSENPRVTFDNISSVKVPEPKINRLALSAFAGAGYDLTDINLKRPRPVAGFGLTYRLN